MKIISIHCSLGTFLESYELELAGLVNTIIDSHTILVEGCIKLAFGVGGYYPDFTRELVNSGFV